MPEPRQFATRRVIAWSLDPARLCAERASKYAKRASKASNKDEAIERKVQASHAIKAVAMTTYSKKALPR
jgi:hypothetical protein